MEVVVCYSEADIFEFSTMLVSCIDKIIKELSGNYRVKFDELSVVVMTSEDHTILNRDYLSHDYPTDVLTFDLSISEAIIGDIYINGEVAQSNAIEHGVSLTEEVLRLVIHGALHLVGLNDASDDERLYMHQLENEYLLRAQEIGFT